jgi:hypothetical protein
VRTKIIAVTLASVVALGGCEGSLHEPAAAPPAATPAAAGEAPAPGPVTPFPGVLVHPAPGGAGGGTGVVELEAEVCLDEGWLEQVACAPGSREHEALVVLRARPSEIHAALLMAGFEPGAPGRWSFAGDGVTFTGPTGSPLDVLVRHDGPAGHGSVEEPVRRWIRGASGRAFPDRPWIFGGSRFAPNPPAFGPGEHYVADHTGSIIGLVTFGDEVVGFADVIADAVDVQPEEWMVDTDAVPPLGTRVTIVLRAPR